MLPALVDELEIRCRARGVREGEGRGGEDRRRGEGMEEEGRGEEGVRW